MFVFFVCSRCRYPIVRYIIVEISDSAARCYYPGCVNVYYKRICNNRRSNCSGRVEPVVEHADLPGSNDCIYVCDSIVAGMAEDNSIGARIDRGY